MHQRLKISIAGTGNVARHLGHALKDSADLIFVLGRNAAKTNELAKSLGCNPTNNPADLAGSDLIVCCYSDDALGTAIPELSMIAPVASTSGTADVLAFAHDHPVGVFYPLQTFSGTEPISFKNLPLFIEASEESLKELLKTLAAAIGANAIEMTAEERLKLHIAAVFTNNFTNHLIAIAQRFAADNKIDYNWLMPLLEQTIRKLHSQTAKDAQTGPARRGDKTTIEKHLSLLNNDEQLIYRMLSESIQKQYS